MTATTKFLVDECFLGPLPTRSLNEFVANSEATLDFEFVTMGQQFGLGVKDEDWIPRLKDQPYVIITADRGRSSEQKLPVICVEHRVTHIIFSRSLSKRDRNGKIAATISIMRSLRKCCTAIPGSRFIVRPKGQRITVDLCKETEKQIKLLNKKEKRNADRPESNDSNST